MTKIPKLNNFHKLSIASVSFALLVIWLWPQSFHECVRQAARDAQGSEQALRWLVGICNEQENAKWWRKK